MPLYARSTKHSNPYESGKLSASQSAVPPHALPCSSHSHIAGSAQRRAYLLSNDIRTHRCVVAALRIPLSPRETRSPFSSPWRNKRRGNGFHGLNGRYGGFEIGQKRASCPQRDSLQPDTGRLTHAHAASGWIRRPLSRLCCILQALRTGRKDEVARLAHPALFPSQRPLPDARLGPSPHSRSCSAEQIEGIQHHDVGLLLASQIPSLFRLRSGPKSRCTGRGCTASPTTCPPRYALRKIVWTDSPPPREEVGE